MGSSSRGCRIPRASSGPQASPDQAPEATAGADGDAVLDGAGRQRHVFRGADDSRIFDVAFSRLSRPPRHRRSDGTLPASGTSGRVGGSRSWLCIEPGAPRELRSERGRMPLTREPRRWTARPGRSTPEGAARGLRRPRGHGHRGRAPPRATGSRRRARTEPSGRGSRSCSRRCARPRRCRRRSRPVTRERRFAATPPSSTASGSTATATTSSRSRCPPTAAAS